MQHTMPPEVPRRDDAVAVIEQAFRHVGLASESGEFPDEQ